jgi:hypothetical protein
MVLFTNNSMKLPVTSLRNLPMLRRSKAVIMLMITCPPVTPSPFTMPNRLVPPSPTTSYRHLEPKRLSPNFYGRSDTHRQFAIKIFYPCILVLYVWNFRAPKTNYWGFTRRCTARSPTGWPSARPLWFVRPLWFIRFLLLFPPLWFVRFLLLFRPLSFVRFLLFIRFLILVRFLLFVRFLFFVPPSPAPLLPPGPPPLPCSL